MRWFVPVALVVSGCGRIGFVGSVDAQIDGPTDGPVDVAIDGGTQPVAVAGADQMVPFVPGGTSIGLDPGLSYDPNGTITNCRVQWTAGSSHNGGCFSIGFLVYLPGIYTVTLTVTDNDGLTAIDTKTITVIASGFPPPVDNLVRFDAGPDQITAAGTPVMFDFSASWNPDGFNYQLYGQNFGDGTGGSTASNLISTHTYAAPGAFTATYSLQGLGIPMAMWPVDTVAVTVN